MPTLSRSCRSWIAGIGSAVALAWPGSGVYAATQTAHYSVRFDGTWSAASHPLDWPPNPHFSSLIGGTHDGSVHFWNGGELASQGIKDMAERGLTSPLDHEVEAAIGAGHGGVVIRGGGISPSPGAVTTSFDITQAHPLVTLVSMIAPTPDWFVGVNSLALFRNGEWADRITVPLYAYDAGTDCGASYTSANCVSNPAQPIAPNPAPPFANGTPLGLFTFTRTDALTSNPVPAASPVALVALALALLGAGAALVARRVRVARTIP